MPSKQKQRKQKQPTRPKRKQKRKTPNRKPNPYVSMIADPCGATLTPGIYGTDEGLLAKFTYSFTNNALNHNCGYVLWCPEYHEQSVFTYVGTNPATLPSNDSQTAGFPLAAAFSIQGLNTGTVSSPPAANFIASSVCRDARTISSCIQLSYFGKMTESAGEICFLDNVPISALIGEQKTPTPGNGGMSVNDLFIAAGSSQRMGSDTYENVWRPTPENSEQFQSNNIEPIAYTINDVFARKLTTTARAQGPTVYGFAFRHLPTSASISPNLTVRLTSNLEWRPNASTYNMTTTNLKTRGREYVTPVLAHLDRASPGWDHRLLSSAKSAASKVASAAFTGAVDYATKNISAIGSQALMLL